MENQDHFEILDFQQKNGLQVQKQRKIFQYYSKLDHEKHKKCKAQIFNLQNIQGLLSVFGININTLQLIRFNQLCTQISTLMQCGLKHHLQFGQQIRIQQGTVIVLMEGSLSKKTQNYMSMNTVINCISILKNKRNSTKQAILNRQSKKKQLTAFENTFLKKSTLKKIQSNSQTAPKLLKYDQDSKTYQCRSETHYFQFYLPDVQKCQKWIQIQQKQALTAFVATCLDIQHKKPILKFLSKIQRVNLHQNNDLSIQNQVVYLINSGQILIKTQTYQTVLNKNSVIYQNQNINLHKATCISSLSIIYAIKFADIDEAFDNYSKRITQTIKNKLFQSHQQRIELFCLKNKQSQENIQSKQPLFNTQILNIKAFQENAAKKHINQSEKNWKKNYIFSRPQTCQKSKRFRISQPNSQQLLLNSNLSTFLSNYPYIKIVQSQQKVDKILRSAIPYKNNKNSQQRNISQQQRKKIEKQIKKMYYNDKVRKLKIKNMAEKQIPNGHKKAFNAEKAENQIIQYSLFKNIIEYPTKGINQNATKKTEGKKLVEKFAKMSIIHQKPHRVTVGATKICNTQQQNLPKKQSEVLIDGDKFLKSIIDGQQNKNAKKQQILSLKILENIQNCSFYCTNILSPHLKTQRYIKYKKEKSQINQNYDMQNSAMHNLQQNIKFKKDKKIQNNLRQAKNYERIKTTQ